MLERLTGARRHVDALRSALLSSSPDELEKCLPSLEEAVGCLREVEQQLNRMTEAGKRPITPQEFEALRQEANALKESVEIARRVILQGHALVDGCLNTLDLNMLGLTAAGYTAAGTLPTVSPVAKVSVEG